MFRSLSYMGQFKLFKYATGKVHDKWEEQVKSNPELKEPNRVEDLTFNTLYTTADGSDSMHRTVVNYIRGCQYHEVIDLKIALCEIYTSELKYEKNVVTYEVRCMDALHTEKGAK